MPHSEKCPDPTTRWKETKCVSCDFKPGHYVTPNCGFDDRGGRHERPHQPCASGTFNDGSRAYCQNCTFCPPSFITVSPCSSTTDIECRDTGERTSVAPSITQTLPTITSQTTINSQGTSSNLHWAAPLATVILITLVLLSALLIYVKRRKGRPTTMVYNKRSSYINAGFSSLSGLPDNSDLLEDVLSPAIVSAPLQIVLDNLDVLEELVILLDPESHGVKNTKHLASHCSFPSTWITYTYSMRDSKSPLKAVLEGVTSRHPEWTVGHLAKMLRLMERNDAITALTKLQLKELEV